MDEQLKTFAFNVQRHMTRLKLASAVLASRSKISPKTLNNLLNGRHAPQLDVLSKIADALKVPLWLLWLPDIPFDAPYDEAFPQLVETAAKLSPDALKAVKRVADLEYRASKPS